MMKRYYAEGVMSRHAAELFSRNRHNWRKLRRKKVLVAGAGGLGSFVVAGLVGTGVGEIHVVDRDMVELSNLNRQFFYGVRDVGRPKTDVIMERLRDRPAEVKGISGDVRDVDVGEYDVVFDCLDEWDVKMDLLARGVKEGVPVVLMSVGEGVGLVSVPKRVLPFRPRKSRYVSTPEIMVTAGFGLEEGLRILQGEKPLLLDRILFVDLRSFSLFLSEIK